MSGQVAQVDALVAGFDADLGDQPGIGLGDVVLVMGPWLAGSTSLVDALRRELPAWRFVEAGELDPDEAPAAVVFAVSAVAPLTDSDSTLLEAAAANTDLLVGALTKVDVYRQWRDVLAANRKALATHDARYRDITWVPVAAAPEVGEPRLDELVDALLRGLADPTLPRRNRLRAWQFRIDSAIRRCRDDAGTGRQERMAELRDQRREVLRRLRLTRSERAIELRSQIQQVRVRLTYFARNQCSSVRTELQEDAAGSPRRRLPAFENYVRMRIDEALDDVDSGVTAQLAELAVELELTPPPDEPASPVPPIPSPPRTSRRLETRLIALLGAGFGLGVAFTLSRLFAGLAPGYAAVGLLAGAVVGFVAALWVVGIRGLLYHRAVLDRWVSEVIADVRAHAEELVATRALHAEAVLSAQESALDRTRAAELADLLTDIDAELREHASAVARAVARRNRELPTLHRARDAVQAELTGRKVVNLNRSCE